MSNFIAGDTAEHVTKDVADNILIGTLTKDVADKIQNCTFTNMQNICISWDSLHWRIEIRKQDGL